MIPYNPTGNRTSGKALSRTNEGRQLSDTERQNNRNYSRIPLVSDVLDMFGGGGQPEMQTTTQQNLPSWAIPDAMSTLAMGNYYTQNPDYRPSTLDRDYSGIRGGASGVGQQGLNPRRQALPALPGANLDGTMPYRPNDMNNLVAQLSLMRAPEPGAGITGNLFGGGMGVSGRALQNIGPNSFQPGTGLIENPNSPGFVDDRKNRTSRGMSRSTGWWDSDDDSSDDSSDDSGWSWEVPQIDLPDWNFDSLVEDTWLDDRPQSDPGELAYPTSLPETPTQSPQGDIRPDGSNSEGPGYPTGNDSPTTQTQPTSSENQGGNTNTQTNTTTTTQPEIDPRDIFNPDDLTPFSAYDRQRFAAPSDRTLQGENLLANRVYGGNPFAEAQAAARGASNYQSKFTPAALNLTGPKANSYNNVNQKLLAEEYGNANAGLTPAQNYSRNFQQNLAQFEDPYTSQVVDQTIKDLDRARRITNNDISGNAARVGAFGGSREALMRTENNRNFADRTAAAVGQLRSQGFQQAAERAQQEQLQRLGLTASDIQNLRGYQSAGNLQGQNISAQDVRDVRGLQSQGALTAQGLGAQSDRDAMNYANQLQMQGNQLGVEQARLAEQFRQGAGALNLQGAGALGNLAQMQTADERQRIADLLASGGAQDARNQQDLDFIFSEFNRELDYPGRQIDLRNAAISPATGSIVTTTQPRYSSGGLPQAAGVGLATYGALAGIPAAAPYALPAALAMGLLNY